MLYLIATPIGNLSDMTFRAIETLKACHYILCEDTRHSLVLLNHYNIHKPLHSYHKFNEASKMESILADLRNGQQIALISDAGTPGISDPGADLVRQCIEHNLTVTAIPGPCAAIQALSCSGLPTERFQFWGFLPRKDSELRLALQEILSYPSTTICYESPKRLIEVLHLIQEIEPSRQLVVARELTKKFEEICRGTAHDLLLHWQSAPLKGEIVLLFAPYTKQTHAEWNLLSPAEHVELLQNTYGIKCNEAIKIVSHLRGLSKHQLYKDIHRK